MAYSGMQISITNPDITNDPRAIFVPPVTRGLQYYNYFDGNPDNTARNLVPGKPQGVIVGNPVVDALGVTFQGFTNYVQTDCPHDSDGSTVIAVWKSVQEAAAVIWSNLGSPSQTLGTDTGGFSLYTQDIGGADGNVRPYLTAGLINAGVNFSHTATGGNLPAVMPASKLFSGRSSMTTDLRTLINHTDNLTYASSVDDRPINRGGKFRIGSQSNNGITGLVHISAVAYFNVDLTDAERTAAVAFMRAYYAARGRVV